MDLDAGAGVQIDRQRVPSELRDLVTVVERWAFDDQGQQDRFVELMLCERPEEVREFNQLMDSAEETIDAWGRTFPKKSWEDLTDDEKESPYWTFLDAQKVRELTGYEPDDPGVALAKARHQTQMREERFNAVVLTADEAFRGKDYRQYISLLSPFEDLLSGIQKKKMQIAANKAGE